jgi:hypothetical protein
MREIDTHASAVVGPFQRQDWLRVKFPSTSPASIEQQGCRHGFGVVTNGVKQTRSSAQTVLTASEEAITAAETRVPMPMKAGRPARFDYEYERNGTANLFMMFAPLKAGAMSRSPTAADVPVCNPDPDGFFGRPAGFTQRPFTNQPYQFC